MMKMSPQEPNDLSAKWYRQSGFTLLELLVSTAILGIIVTLVVGVIASTQDAWIKSKSRVDQFRDARLAFELITRNLAQADLNTYYDYGQTYYAEDTNVRTAPASYTRESELQFLTGRTATLLNALPGVTPVTHMALFYAPLGYVQDNTLRPLNALLNARGYYVAWGDDAALRPQFLGGATPLPNFPLKHRFRLMEYIPPSEQIGVYDVAAPGKAPDIAWFNTPDFAANSRPVADNIVALILSPRETPDTAAFSSLNQSRSSHISPEYHYDSTQATNDGSSLVTSNLLPPLVMVTLVAIDEASARRMEATNGGITTIPSLVDDVLWFRSVDSYETDLSSLTDQLQAQNLNYRVFSATVPIRSAKWSP